MAKTKIKPDEKLYDRLRSSGVRKKVAAKVSDALPKHGAPKPGLARRAAADLSSAADEIKDRVKGGPKKRSAAAAKKAASTRKAKAAKRSAAGKKAARTRAKKS
jgi:hypothetical protein